jgi:CRP/FNR family transcriptional regulator, cyclic AMP receptor protein
VKDRFVGVGKPLLVEALRRQPLVEFDSELAEALADAGEIEEFDPGAVMVRQGGDDNHVLFLVSGEVDVAVNDRRVATRIAGTSIGEMALVSPGATRSATVTAAKSCVALVVQQLAFQAIAERFPKVWRPLAELVSARLRERERFHRLPNPTPILFLGSSVEGLPVANEIVSGLKHDDVAVRVWTLPGLFSPGGTPIDVLLKEVDSADFSAFVFGPDDQIGSRKAKYSAPRDNVVFELGLFMGRLTRDRAMVIMEHKANIKIPTDLLGVQPITYVIKNPPDLTAAMQTVCNDLRRLIMRLGPL